MPKISAVLHNCGLHSAIPSVMDQLASLAENPSASYAEQYGELKDKFCEYYDLDKKTITFKLMHSLIKDKSFNDLQLILGPVLREYFVTHFIADADESFKAAASEFGSLSPGPDCESNPYIQANDVPGNFFGIPVNLLSKHLFKPLGISITLLTRLNNNAKFSSLPFPLEQPSNPITNITIYHTESDGHYELEESPTPNPEGGFLDRFFQVFKDAAEQGKFVGEQLHTVTPKQINQNVQRVLETLKAEVILNFDELIKTYAVKSASTAQAVSSGADAKENDLNSRGIEMPKSKDVDYKPFEQDAGVLVSVSGVDQRTLSEKLRSAIQAYNDADKTSLRLENQAYIAFETAVNEFYSSLVTDSRISIAEVDVDHRLFLIVDSFKEKPLSSQKELDQEMISSEESMSELVNMYYVNFGPKLSPNKVEPIKQAYREKLRSQLQPLYQEKLHKILKEACINYKAQNEMSESDKWENFNSISSALLDQNWSEIPSELKSQIVDVQSSHNFELTVVGLKEAFNICRTQEELEILFENFNLELESYLLFIVQPLLLLNPNDEHRLQLLQDTTSKLIVQVEKLFNLKAHEISTQNTSLQQDDDVEDQHQASSAQATLTSDSSLFNVQEGIKARPVTEMLFSVDNVPNIKLAQDPSLLDHTSQLDDLNEEPPPFPPEAIPEAIFEQAFRKYKEFVDTLFPSCSVETLHLASQWKKYSTSKQKFLDYIEQTNDKSTMEKTKASIQKKEQRAYNKKFKVIKDEIKGRTVGSRFDEIKEILKSAPDATSAKIVLDAEQGIFQTKQLSQLRLLNACFESVETQDSQEQQEQLVDMLQRFSSAIKEHIPKPVTKPKKADTDFLFFLSSLSPDFNETDDSLANLPKKIQSHYKKGSKELQFVDRLEKVRSARTSSTLALAQDFEAILKKYFGTDVDVDVEDLFKMSKIIDEIESINRTLPKANRLQTLGFCNDLQHLQEIVTKAAQQAKQSERINQILKALNQIDRESQDPPNQELLSEVNALREKMSEEQSTEFNRLLTIFAIRSLTAQNLSTLAPEKQGALKQTIFSKLKENPSYGQDGNEEELEMLYNEYATPLIVKHLSDNVSRAATPNLQELLGNTDRSTPSQQGTTPIITIGSGTNLTHTAKPETSTPRVFGDKAVTITRAGGGGGGGEGNRQGVNVHANSGFRRPADIPNTSSSPLRSPIIEGKGGTGLGSSDIARDDESSRPDAATSIKSSTEARGGGQTRRNSFYASPPQAPNYNQIVSVAIQKYSENSKTLTESNRYGEFSETLKVVDWGNVNPTLTKKVYEIDAFHRISELSLTFEKQIYSCNSSEMLNSTVSSIRANYRNLVLYELNESLDKLNLESIEEYHTEYCKRLDQNIQMMEERQRQTLSSSPSPSPRSTAGGGGEGGARVQLPEVDPQGNEAHTINSSSTFRGIVSTARHIKRDNVKVDNDTYELATSTKDPSYAQATLSWGGVQNRNESTTVEQQTPAVQQQICNDIMHMIGNVLAKGGPAHISSQDPFVLKFAGHYLKVLKANDSTIKYNLPPGAPIATADDIRTFNGYIDNYHKRAHSEDVKAWMDDRIAALPKREEHESDLPIGYGASGTSLRNR